MTEEQRLITRKGALKEELREVEAALTHIERMKKPFEAVVHHWCCNRSSTFWKTEEQARKKMDEYFRKAYYLNGRVDRVQLVKYEEDGSTTIIDDKKK
ncbi:hypothetical protein MKX34_24145 [Paenibacillus sp. FSL R5-0636]|uniref:hypothetical protein n=1 Tax=Paenibacillus TaxID=44249 RepID=UPI00096E4D6C|nr:hypothetical protein [Paenibacillus odorifer]OMC96258.1 hypothetical protein BJP49_11190 [Paenibacillus odorifer]